MFAVSECLSRSFRMWDEHNLVFSFCVPFEACCLFMRPLWCVVTLFVLGGVLSLYVSLVV